MSAYIFRLHDGGAVPPLDETVTAEDLEEAHDLAQLRLLLSARFTRVEVFEAGVLRLNLARDGAPPGAKRLQSRNPGREHPDHSALSGLQRKTAENMDQSDSHNGSRKGPLKPTADIGEVLVENPPNDSLLMTPDEADVSAIRLMESADKARLALKDPGFLKR